MLRLCNIHEGSINVAYSQHYYSEGRTAFNLRTKGENLSARHLMIALGREQKSLKYSFVDLGSEMRFFSGKSLTKSYEQAFFDTPFLNYGRKGEHHGGFFFVANLQRIHTWGSHVRNSIRCRMSTKQTIKASSLDALDFVISLNCSLAIECPRQQEFLEVKRVSLHIIEEANR